jgi:hypothetical protein
VALNAYITATQRLLHDANARFWSVAELTDYVNDARRKCALHTGCLRSLEDVTLTEDDETYDLATFTSLGERAIDMLNLTVIWGTQRIPMLWAPWTVFNARYRMWVTNTQRPAIWSNYGTSPVVAKFYVQPVPDQDYDAQADIIYSPATLVDNSTVDDLGYPFTEPVPFYAAYLAKLKQQAYGEAQQFLQNYVMKAKEAQMSFTRKLPNPLA